MAETALGSRVCPQLARGLKFAEKVTDPDRQREVVQDAYKSTGHLLDEISDAVLLVDALCMDFPIVGASKGFCDMTKYKLEDVIGQNCRLLLEGVPHFAISRSSRKNIQDYCSMCQLEDLTDISHVTSVQPNQRADGSHFVNFFMLGLCMVQRRNFILGVQVPLGEGVFVKLSQKDMSALTEQTRTTFKQIRSHLRCTAAGGDEGLEAAPAYLRHAIVAQPDFAFFAERLQDHCLLINNGFTAIRREPQELAFNCLVFGDRPVRRCSDGLRFTVHVDEVTPTFTGLPMLGFTKRKPGDSMDLYPSINKCLGASVLVGGCGEAFVRDKTEHFKMGFKQPPSEEIQIWTLQPGLPPHKRTPPTKIAHGDLLHCVYTWDGRVKLLKNQDPIIAFDVGRPIEQDTDYYAVVDVCFSAYSLTIMPSPRSEVQDELEAARPETTSTMPAQVSAASEVSQSGTSNVTMTLAEGLSRQCSDLRTDFDSGTRLSTAVNDILVKQSIKEIVASCKFMVTIADPRGKDCPLIAVSEEFETMTGFTRAEILGVNCRFLNQGCDMDPADLTSLRIASKTGAPFTAVIPNRKKSGEMFLNLLDLRGLTVARNPVTKEDLWFLIGIQADVTDLAQDEFPKDHLSQLQMVADGIRLGIKKELSKMAMIGAASTSEEPPKLEAEKLKLGTEQMKNMRAAGSSERWLLLSDPAWRPGTALGMRRPEDSPAHDMLAEVTQAASPSSVAKPTASGDSHPSRPSPAAAGSASASSAPATQALESSAMAERSSASVPEKTPEPDAQETGSLADSTMTKPISRGEALLLASVVLLGLFGMTAMAARRRG